MTKNQNTDPKGKAASAYAHAYYDTLGEAYGLADLVTMTHPDPKHVAALGEAELTRMASALADLKDALRRLAHPLYEQARNMPDGFIEG